VETTIKLNSGLNLLDDLNRTATYYALRKMRRSEPCDKQKLSVSWDRPHHPNKRATRYLSRDTQHPPLLLIRDGPLQPSILLISPFSFLVAMPFGECKLRVRNETMYRVSPKFGGDV
jgi:hypothetical protein